MNKLNTFLVVLNLALVGACSDGSDLEERKQALWVNPAASPCNGEQPAFTLRVYRWNDGTGPCLQFGSNIEINNLGLYTWSDGSSLNDNVGKLVGNLWGNPGKTQKVTVWWDWMFVGPSASHQVTYTGQPGQGYQVWLYNPWNFTFGASSLRYEVW